MAATAPWMRTSPAASTGRILSVNPDGTVTVAIGDGTRTATVADGVAGVVGRVAYMVPFGQSQWVVLGVASQQSGVTVGPNLVPNGDFESSTTALVGWVDDAASTSNSSSILDPSVGHSSAQSAAIQCITSDAAVRHVLRTDGPLRVDPGASYRVQAWVQQSGATHGVSVRLAESATDSAPVDLVVVADTTVTSGSGWTLLAGSFTPGDGQTYAEPLLVTSAAQAAVVSPHWDDVYIQRAT